MRTTSLKPKFPRKATSMMKVLSIVGARPQFIKAAPVSKALRQQGIDEFLVHTGQHYDYGMSQIFFDELGIPEPVVNLEVGSGPHGWQTGHMLIRLEEVIQRRHPDWVLVYGDTNSTLAGALAACKLHIPLAHVEAGLRSYNREMPEEHNRVLADHCSDLLFCPTQTAVDNLEKEGITRGVHLVGDPMYDAVLQFSEIAGQHSSILEELGLTPKKYLLATVHRPYNTDIPENLSNIMAAFREAAETIVFPVHPRTRLKITELDGLLIQRGGLPLKLVDPVGYLDMLELERNARLILTDSGGMQKEAYFFGTPCLTLRPETEWVETVQTGWNQVVGVDRGLIMQGIKRTTWPENRPELFGDGRAAEAIAQLLHKNA